MDGFIKNASKFHYVDHMRSYIKIYGPPIFEAIKALEKMAIDLDEVCIMDPLIESRFSTDNVTSSMTTSAGSLEAMEYFTPLKSDISQERCESLISKSGRKLGDFDFYFEWFSEPTLEELNKLIQKIDETLKPLGVRYTIISKK